MDDMQSLYKTLENSIKKTKKIQQYKKGDVAEAIVEKLSGNYIVIKIDEVFDAVVPAGELIKDAADYVVGETIKVSVLKSEDEYGNMIVSQKRTESGQRWEVLSKALENNESLIVTVNEANSGGVIVNYEGISGFIPISQLDPNKVYKLESETSSKEDLHRELTKRLSDLSGTKLSVKAVQVDKDRNKVIFSEKLALIDLSPEQRKETIKNAKVNDVMEGVVTAVAPYGIFVNAEGLEGLVHVSEISWDKVVNTADFAKVGDKIKVRLIDIDEEGKRVAYSIKQLSEDPWGEVAQDYKVGGKVNGTVTSIEDYGVIIKIADGVTGLIHKSELSDQKMGDPKDFFQIGQDVEAIIMTISPSERKMGLSLKRLLSPSKSSKPKSKGAKKPKVPGALDIAGALAKANKKSAKEEESVEETQASEDVETETKDKEEKTEE